MQSLSSSVPYKILMCLSVPGEFISQSSPPQRVRLAAHARHEVQEAVAVAHERLLQLTLAVQLDGSLYQGHSLEKDLTLIRHPNVE